MTRNNPNRTHHCEKCQGPFKYTCVDDEHMYQCPTHEEVYSKKQGACATCELEEFMRTKREREDAEKEQKMQKKLAEDAWFRDPKADDAKKNKKDNKKLKNKAHTVGRLFGRRWYIYSK